jgi:hypothetical protein
MKKIMEFNWSSPRRIFLNWKSEWMKANYWDLDFSCCTWDSVGVWIGWDEWERVGVLCQN